MVGHTPTATSRLLPAPSLEDVTYRGQLDSTLPSPVDLKREIGFAIFRRNFIIQTHFPSFNQGLNGYKILNRGSSIKGGDLGKDFDPIHQSKEDSYQWGCLPTTQLDQLKKT
ncbi:hypothetical protein M9H77_30598 [Catharanthus roseus]|uniref:Uncharacterized protein n=1 Tax=Catharanthus roseus TaxID=4058 RepID=A0ACB9ZY32_CATRO|nr:hypothetical protein M9H77_30598 [Catharanthus roseus]